MSEIKVSGGGGVFTLLGILFVALKLTGYISWSWWYVTLPFWGGLAFILAIAIIAGFFGLLYALIFHKHY